MARRNGGTTAPRGGAGGRRQEIVKAGRGARAAQGRMPGEMERLPAGDLPRRAAMPGRASSRGGPAVGGQRARAGAGGQARAGVSRGQIAGIGDQLNRRVSQGAISTEQAQRTARERQTFAKAFGKDWREDVFGGTGKIRQARQALAQDPDNPKLLARNKRLQKSRQQALEEARAKLKGATTGKDAEAA